MSWPTDTIDDSSTDIGRATVATGCWTCPSSTARITLLATLYYAITTDSRTGTRRTSHDTATITRTTTWTIGSDRIAMARSSRESRMVIVGTCARVNSGGTITESVASSSRYRTPGNTDRTRATSSRRSRKAIGHVIARSASSATTAASCV